MPGHEKHIFICANQRPDGHPKGSCSEGGAASVADTFRAGLHARDLLGRFKVVTTGCLGFCGQGPMILIYPEGVMYQQVSAADIEVVIEEHLLGGTPVERLKVPAELWG